MATKKRVSLVQLAAKLYGCAVEELLSYREYEDGSVVIIAPSGQKFSYSAERIREEAEVRKGPEVPKVAKVTKDAEVPEEPEGPKETKVTKVADEHAGPVKRSR